MTYVLVGPSYLAPLKEEELILENHFQDEERFTYGIEEISLFTLLEHINTISFLSPKKVVILKDAFFLSSDGPRKVSDEEISALTSYLQNQSQDVLLILRVEKLDERKRNLMKTIRDKTTMIQLNMNLEERIKTHFREYQLENGVINSLMLAVKGEEARIDSECEKLKTYRMNEKKITKKDVEDLVKFSLPDQEETIFSFSRALASKDKRKAYQDYSYLEQMGVDPIFLLGLLESQFRTLYQVKVLKDKGYTKEKIADSLKMHPYRVLKTQELLHFFTKKDIRNYLLLIQSFDYKMKSGQIDSQFLIDLLIMRV